MSKSTRIALFLDPTLLARLDAAVEREEARRPHAQVTRGEIIREALDRFLHLQEDAYGVRRPG